MMNATTRVSQHIPDISPSLSYRKERSITTFPTSRRRLLQPRMEVIQEIEPSAAWNKLPNLTQYKSAIVRRKVCQGLVYLLPGDKNARSLARPYTADLNQIFNKPYSELDMSNYNDETVKQACAVHFNTEPMHNAAMNAVPQRDPASLNSESRKKYHDYELLTLKKNNLRQRKDNDPTSVKGGPGEANLQEEVKQILDEVGIQTKVLSNEEEDEMPITDRLNTRPSTVSNAPPSPIYRPSIARPVTQPSQSTGSLNPREFRGQKYTKKSADYKNYKELRDAAVKRPVLPEDLRSKHLSREKCDEIWSWLHWDFDKSKFQQFLEVCD